MPAKRSTKQRVSRKPTASACFPGILGWWRWSGSQQEPLGTLCGSTPAPPWQVFGGAAFLRAGEGWGPGKCCRTSTGGGEDYWKEQRWGGIVAWMLFLVKKYHDILVLWDVLRGIMCQTRSHLWHPLILPFFGWDFKHPLKKWMVYYCSTNIVYFIWMFSPLFTKLYIYI